MCSQISISPVGLTCPIYFTDNFSYVSIDNILSGHVMLVFKNENGSIETWHVMNHIGYIVQSLQFEDFIPTASFHFFILFLVGNCTKYDKFGCCYYTHAQICNDNANKSLVTYFKICLVLTPFCMLLVDELHFEFDAVPFQLIDTTFCLPGF